MISKFRPLVSKKLREAARRKPCIRCHVDDGTVCGRHNEGFRKSMLGKGRGIKCDDFAMADLCDTCDREMSDDLPGKGTVDALEHAEEWNFLCLLTLIRRREEGVIKVEGLK